MAQHARISKRTFYHRFPDKAALFGAVVHRIIEVLRPPAGTPIYEGGSLEEVLRRLARLMLALIAALSRQYLGAAGCPVPQLSRMRREAARKRLARAILRGQLDEFLP